MKREFIPTILVIVILLLCLFYYYVFYGNNNETYKEIKVVPTLISKLEKDTVWCAPFQLIWNDLKNEVIKKEIFLVNDENNQMVKDLNQETITSNDINEKYYYKKHGYMTLDLKSEIEKSIKEKFNEKSDILDSFQFEKNSKNYLLYAMLFRKFEFSSPFDILNDDTFGIDSDSDEILNDNVKVLYYNDYDNYAVKLLTKDNDELILIKGKNNKNNFLEIFKEIDTKTETNFEENDTISVSNFDFKLKVNFPEIEDKQIKDSDFVISETIQTINFTLDNTGGKVKSEAGMLMKSTAVANPGRYFDFTDNYVLFLKEKDKDKPYFAMKIDDIENFKK